MTREADVPGNPRKAGRERAATTGAWRHSTSTALSGFGPGAWYWTQLARREPSTPNSRQLRSRACTGLKRRRGPCCDRAPAALPHGHAIPDARTDHGRRARRRSLLGARRRRYRAARSWQGPRIRPAPPASQASRRRGARCTWLAGTKTRNGGGEQATLRPRQQFSAQRNLDLFIHHRPHQAAMNNRRRARCWSAFFVSAALAPLRQLAKNLTGMQD